MIRPTFILGSALALVACGLRPPAHGDEPARPAPAPPVNAPAAVPPALPADAPAPTPTAPVARPGDASAEAPAPAADAAPPKSETTAVADDDATSESSLVALSDSIKLDLEQQLKSLEGAGLGEADKQQAIKFYQQAIESFNVANQQLAAARKFEDDIKLITAPEQVEDAADGLKNDRPHPLQYYEVRLARPLPPHKSLEDLSLAEVEKAAATLERSLKSYTEQLAELESEPKRRSTRLAALPKEIAEYRQKAKQAADDLGAVANEDVKDAVALARRAALTLAKQRFDATVQALEREQRLYQQGGDFIKVKRDYFARYVPHKEKRRVQLREEINERREREAQQEVDDAAEQARQVAKAGNANRPKVLVRLAEENELLAKRRAQIVADNTRVTQEALTANERLASLKKRFESAQEQVQIAELSDFNGELLRKEQADLPKLNELRRRGVERRAESVDVLIEQYALNDQRSALANLDDLMEKLAAKAKRADLEVRAEVRKLLEAKRGYLDDLITDYGTYSTNLNELDSVESQLVALTEEYSAFIAERVLWIRSAAPIGPADLAPASQALAWSLHPDNWAAAGKALVAAARRSPAPTVVAIATIVALLVAQTPIRRRLRVYGDDAAKRSCTKLRPTFHALWLTAALALPWPALVACLGVTLSNPLNESEFVRALGGGLSVTAMCLLILELLRHLCRTRGLADSHFDWPEACLVQLRKKLRWLIVLGLPLILWLTALEAQRVDAQWNSSLGRACFLGVMLLLATLLQRLLLSRGNPFRKLVLYSERGWLMPLQVAWRPAVVLLPAVLAVLAAVGYYYTAQQAATRLVQTVTLLLAVLALGGFTRRWLMVNRRRLAREQAKQRRAQAAAAADAEPSAPPPLELSDEIPDLAALSEQTQKLVRTFLAITTTVGIVLIWAAILPALAYLGQAQINPAADPNSLPLTWGQLFTVIGVLGITFVSVRDIPALLELVVLQHLPLDGGFRYAVTSVCRYVLAAVGLAIAFNRIGWHWDDVQWLVAAMSVGLGFGLQEIFANFVSGIILLFERPIRVGDVVTLGDKTGVVNRIRMRATIIVDWDRKEYIVPNKDLVTERLLNWTLSDHINRVEVVTSVATGSDTNLACALLLEAAREQPHVLAEPAPVAMFDGFTETGLKLVLRCFLPSLENRGTTIHGLNTAIDMKLRAAGIEGAYGDMRVRLAREAAPTAAHVPFAGRPAAAASPAEKRHGAA